MLLPLRTHARMLMMVHVAHSMQQVQRCVEYILKHNHKKVALQFPDSLLVDSVAVTEALIRGCNQHVFVLADTVYGSCCVDEVAAEHAAADMIIHYGVSCLSQASRTPVLFVFGRRPISIPKAAKAFETLLENDAARKAVVLYDVEYAHCIEELEALMSKGGDESGARGYSEIVWSRLAIPEPTEGGGYTSRACRPQTAAAAAGGGCCGGGGGDGEGSACQSNVVADAAPSATSEAASAPPASTPAEGNCGNDSGSCATCPPPSTTAIASPAGSSADRSVPTPAEAEGSKVGAEEKEAAAAEAAAAFGRSFELADGCSISDYVMLYIGPESHTLTNLMLQYSQSEFYSYDPVKNDARKETLNASKALRRRYYMVQVAKDAKTVGILAGTLGVADYLQVLSDLKQLCKNAGKKTYTFIMGKLNPAKLANFMEIDCFVLIACRENTLIESRDFYRPIVTPFELELACVKGKEWTGEYELDFRRILPKLAEDLAVDKDADSNAANAAEDDEEDEEFSFITGKFTPKAGKSTSADGTEKAIVAVQDGNTAIAVLKGASYLASRSYRGLEQKVGETAVRDAVTGRGGIAMGYSEEGRTDDIRRIVDADELDEEADAGSVGASGNVNGTIDCDASDDAAEVAAETLLP